MAAVKDVGPVLVFLAAVIAALIGLLQVRWTKLSARQRKGLGGAAGVLTLIGLVLFVGSGGKEAPDPDSAPHVSIHPTFVNNPVIAPTIAVPEARNPTPTLPAPSAETPEATAEPTPPPRKVTSPPKPSTANTRPEAPQIASPRVAPDSTTINVTGSYPTVINGTGTVIHNHAPARPAETR